MVALCQRYMTLLAKWQVNLIFYINWNKQTNKQKASVRSVATS